MPTYSRDRLPYNLLKKQYLRPGENAYTYFDNLAAWIRAGSATSKNYSVSTTNGGVVQNEFAPTRFQFPAFYVNEGSAGGGPEFRITHTSNFSDTFGPKNGLVISLWFKLLEFSHDDANNFGSNILCITDGSSSQRIIDVFCTESGASNPQIGIRIYDASSPSTKFLEILSSQSINASDWNHVLFWIDSDAESAGSVASMSASHAKLYVNGKNTALSSPTYSTASSSTISISHSATSVIVKLGNGGGSSVPASSTVDTSYMNGYVSDLAIYNSADDLSESLLQILYKLSVQGAYQEQSGFLNNPERIMRNTLDERSYWPSTVKGGDQRRLGNAAIKWDDYKLPEYTTKQVSYPSMLHRNDSLLTSSIYQTYVDGQLNAVTGSRTIPQYAYDMFYEREDEVSPSPFEDSRVYIDQSSDFYLSGSDIPGFTGSLAGKDVVVMEFELDSDTLFGSNRFSTSGSHSPQREMKFMGYYNPVQKNITLLNGVTEPSSDLSLNAHFYDQFSARHNYIDNDLFTRAAIGFSALPESLSSGSSDLSSNGLGSYDELYYSGSCHPIDNFGFPSDNRYFASGSNTIKFSNFSAHPFVVEKLVINLPNMDAHIASTNNGYPYDKYVHSYSSIFSNQSLEWQHSFNSMNFFIMKQRASYVTGSTFTIAPHEATRLSMYVDQFPSVGADQLHFHIEAPITSNTNRDLLFNASIGFTHGSGSAYSYSSYVNSFFEQKNFTNNFDFFTTNYIGDHSIGLETDTAGNHYPVISARDIQIELDSEVYNSTDITTAIDLVLPAQTNPPGTKIYYDASKIALKWNLGLRNNTDKFSNIDISNSNSTNKGKKRLFIDVSGLSGAGRNVDYSIPGDKKSPVILFPEDDLILGFQSQMPFSFTQANYYGITPAIGSKIYSGSIKIQLFGSYIQDSKPKLPMLNQTHGYTEAVHGAIGEISVHDQWDISYRQEFSGSNPDTFMGIATYFPGASNPDGVDINEGLPERDGITAYHNMTGSDHFGIGAMNAARSGLASNGTIGDFGSLSRNYRLSEQDLYDKDSIIFSVKDLWAADNSSSAFIFFGGFQLIGIGDYSTAFNPHWTHSFPFEDKYATASRIFKQTHFGPNLPLISIRSTSPDEGKYSIIEGDPGVVTAKKNTNIYSFSRSENFEEWYIRNTAEVIFSIGAGPGGRYEVYNNGSSDIIGNFRGAKYGLSNWWPTSRSAVFRRTSYGQFRDMLEPRLYGPTLDSNLTQIDDPIVSRVLISNGAVEFLDAADSIIGNKDENYRVKTPFFDIPEVPVTISPVDINNIVTTVIDSL